MCIVGIIMGLAQIIDKWIRKIFSNSNVEPPQSDACLMDHCELWNSFEYDACLWEVKNFKFGVRSFQNLCYKVNLS